MPAESRRTIKDYPVIALDFDGTVVRHRYPDVGEEIGAADWIRKWIRHGARIILWTMRDGRELSDAKQWYRGHGLPLHGVQLNPRQAEWTSSPKCYAKLYIDDHGLFAPLIQPDDDGRPYVDWSIVGPRVLGMLR